MPRFIDITYSELAEDISRLLVYAGVEEKVPMIDYSVNTTLEEIGASLRKNLFTLREEIGLVEKSLGKTYDLLKVVFPNTIQ